MNSDEIRQSFLDYFADKGHAVVPSAPLLPSSPNLLFTNAGMNQFVPYFLGEREAPYPRAVDSQKCIRAGGKHNDLEDVGFDTYHHTFFEMLGNWSFGDYFKTEAIDFAWELLTEVWGFPKQRLYATVYQPGDGDPAGFDDEAYAHWKKIFEREGLDPERHIHYGGKEDNFWMMGETGPCGPCSELHLDLTPEGNAGGKLVNADSPWCIEIWNLVFIQFNADADGGFTDLPARHVDTGMGFERVAGILATTKGFTDFSNPPSNYDSDLFTEIFEHLSRHCSHRYGHTMPADRNRMSEAEQQDCAFRVIADHGRTLTFAIADGILPGNEGRNYVLRRILRRAVMFGKRLELPDGFFARLAPVIIEKMGAFFPELKKQDHVIRKVIAAEESNFEKTLERGLKEFETIAARIASTKAGSSESGGTIQGHAAFKLYDTYGFPLDLTQLLARERGLTVDLEGFREYMAAQRERARAAQKKETISVRTETDVPATEFVGFELENAQGWRANVQSSTPTDNGRQLVVLDATPFYGEMGGQLGDTGTLTAGDKSFPIVDTKIRDGVIFHEVDSSHPIGGEVTVTIDIDRRRKIQRHHSGTHLLNWALRSVLGDHIRQAGSLVAPDYLRFDFAHFEALTPEELETIERKVNQRILENAPVETYHIPIDEKPDDIIAVFGEKYGEIVRVVDIGGFSKELCGGTHVGATGEIGLCAITAESAIAAGTRRIEAVCGEAAHKLAEGGLKQIHAIANRLGCKTSEVGTRVETLLEQRQELEKQLKRMQQAAAARETEAAIGKAFDLGGGIQGLVTKVEAPNPEELRGMATALSKKLGESVVVLGAAFGDKLTVVATATPAAVEAGYKAGEIIRDLTGKLGGKGGGKPNFAMGGAPNKTQLEETLAAYRPPASG
ncbi:MAG: alanine--tRNA ligase [Opitutales bacterium]